MSFARCYATPLSTRNRKIFPQRKHKRKTKVALQRSFAHANHGDA